MAYEGKKALQIWVDEETHLKFKTMCSAKNTKMTEVTERLINQWIEEQLKTIPWLKSVQKK